MQYPKLKGVVDETTIYQNFTKEEKEYGPEKF